MEKKQFYYFDGKKRRPLEVITTEDNHSFLAYQSDDREYNEEYIYLPVYDFEYKEQMDPELDDCFIQKVYIGKDEDDVPQYIYIY